MSINYDSKLETLNNKITNLQEDSLNTHNNISKISSTFKELQSLFSNNFSQTISELEFIINHINEINDINTNKKKITDINKLEEEESPASLKPKVQWPNNSYSWRHDLSNTHHTLTSTMLLESSFSISIRVLKMNPNGYITIGVSNKQIDEKKGYLGGDFGKGSWGICGQGSLGQEGNWTTGKTYKEGDIVTITGDNGVISYSVNDEDNSSFKYDMKTTNLYLGATFYYKGDELEIII